MAPARGQSLVLLLFAVAIVGLGGWYWSAQLKQSANASADTQSGTRVKATVHLETFVVNLADREGRSYLRIGVDLGLGRTLSHGEDPPVARLRDAILSVLAAAKADDLLTSEGKVKLKSDVLQAVQQKAPDMDVQEVYLTEILIQR